MKKYQIKYEDYSGKMRTKTVAAVSLLNAANISISAKEIHSITLMSKLNS